MNPTLTIPPEELAKFNRVLKEYLKVNQRAAADAINAKALQGAHFALQETKKVDPNQIRRELGQVGTQRKILKSGKFSRAKNGRGSTALFKEDSFAARIIESKLKKAGKPLIFGEALEKAMRLLLAARLRSRAFISSGWIPSIRGLNSRVKDQQIKSQVRESGAKQYGQRKGRYKAATDSTWPVAEITSSSFKGSEKARAIGIEGLRKAFALVIADMKPYLVRKLGEAKVKALGL